MSQVGGCALSCRCCCGFLQAVMEQFRRVLERFMPAEPGSEEGDGADAGDGDAAAAGGGEAAAAGAASDADSDEEGEWSGVGQCGVEWSEVGWGGVEQSAVERCGVEGGGGGVGTGRVGLWCTVAGSWVLCGPGLLANRAPVKADNQP